MDLGPIVFCFVFEKKKIQWNEMEWIDSHKFLISHDISWLFVNILVMYFRKLLLQGNWYFVSIIVRSYYKEKIVLPFQGILQD